MDMDSKLGKMVLNMKGIGQMTKQMARANYIMQMEIYMKEIGLMTKLMEKESIYIKMEQGILENGVFFNFIIFINGKTEDDK